MRHEPRYRRARTPRGPARPAVGASRTGRRVIAGLVGSDAGFRVLLREAYVDVTAPEPLPPGHPLLSSPNVLVTPRIAGAQGSEVRRLGQYAAAEVARWVAGEPLLGEVTREALPSLVRRAARAPTPKQTRRPDRRSNFRMTC
ncbi:NAD(P)-dependent oxidoreductase [Streptomyces sp. NPDC056835]|uniref:NAD(P)-dependent oxidoreductase n=1 Tax=Streptomyces sp. NPDC056835 TaxID=3345956 RepID=UPI0036AE0961